VTIPVGGGNSFSNGGGNSLVFKAVKQPIRNKETYFWEGREK